MDFCLGTEPKKKKKKEKEENCFKWTEKRVEEDLREKM